MRHYFTRFTDHPHRVKEKNGVVFIAPKRYESHIKTILISYA